MRHRLLLVASGLLLSACGPQPTAFCDLPSEPPSAEDVEDGRLQATRDGEPFDQPATYSIGPNMSLTAGQLDILLARDFTGTLVEDLLGRRAFPICVHLGERGDEVMSANFVEGGLVTDAAHTGRLSILEQDGDILVGRFAVDLVQAQPPPGQEPVETSFENGVFRATRR